jgi:kynureninase
MSLQNAQELDRQDPLSRLRQEFIFPEVHDSGRHEGGRHDSGRQPLYFAGHSLGLMPKKARTYINEELDAWGEFGVEGHFEGKHPWLPYHENITASFARLVGAKETEVVAMNTLTVNLHLMLVSFYRPTQKRYKILIENNTFPSDKYAVDSQSRYHGFDPSAAVVELKPRAGEVHVREEDLLQQIHDLGDSLSVVLLGNCNYLSGQKFDFSRTVETAHSVGAIAGFNLAHGAGNLFLELHKWNVDFAVWCSYKYLNAGPGGIAGAFVHENHLGRKDIPRFEGWWGQNKKTRFKMGPQFDPIPTVEAWQLSNPPIFQLASLRSSLELFDEATMKGLRERGDRLTTYFENQIKSELKDQAVIITPELPARGSMLCLRFKSSPQKWMKTMRDRGVFVDFREPDIIRATPIPLYNSFEDIYRLVQTFKEVIHEF